jgi:hypothetical protein
VLRRTTPEANVVLRVFEVMFDWRRYARYEWALDWVWERR